MTEIIIGATLLILIIMAVRRLTKGMISMKLRYALWIMVVLRLVLPVNIGSSPFSVMNVQKAIRTYVTENMQDMQDESAGISRDGQNSEKVGQKADYTVDSATVIDVDTDGQGIEILSEILGNAGNPASSEMMSSGYNLSASSVKKDSGWLAHGVIGIWITGVIAVGGYMATGQIRFISYLRRTRKEVFLHDLPKTWEERITARGMYVYTVQGLPGPCMTGKSIYINPQLCDEKDRLLHVLAHEYAHAMQGDTLWAIVRCVLCAVYWFHPLVWLAAYESKQDSELACDERAIGFLGEEERFAYGRTLLGLLSDGHSGISYAGAVLMMDGSAKKMRERVAVIAEKKKRSGTTVGIVVLTVVLACGCAFSGAQQTNADMESETEPRRQQEEAAMRAEAEEIERWEQEAIRKHWDELEAMMQQTQQKEAAMRAELEAIERLEQDARQEMQDVRATVEQIAQLEQEEAIIQTYFDEIREEWQQATTEEFVKVLDYIEDDVLESAVPADSLERLDCYDYLYNGAKCPIEDGAWCRLYQDKRYDLEIYGLYTQKYGCRGVKMKIDDDVNTWDMLWQLPVFESGVDVMMLVLTEEGLPQTFAFKICTGNTGSDNVWEFHMADRYDTGTVELYSTLDYLRPEFWFSCKDFLCL